MSPGGGCTLKRGQDGDVEEYFAKTTGHGYNDMIALPTLTKESIIDNLAKRFKSEIVYTYVGDIVVSVNPFKNTGCYGKAIRAKFKGGVRRNLPPHIYALVEHAYGEMNRNQVSQSILISGESGAGKTEAMKICLTFICEVSVQKGQKVSDEVAIRLMQTNPVMEALGNAKTIRNNNSSRFGKHFDVQFSQNGAILGAFTSTYLLEKPRITQHMTGERNYHVFYMLCKAPRPVREPVGVTQWQDYAALNQKGTIEKVETWDDQKEFEDMHEAYCKLGFSEAQRTELYVMLAFVMTLWNVSFVPGKEGSDVKNPKVLDEAARMIQVTPTQLADAISFKTMGGGKLSTYKVPLEPRHASAAKAALCAHVYCLVFDWCVDVINDYVSVHNAAYCVGILDIFGFENFSFNSFPQMCINFTNESLHNLFIEHVFKLEQEVYIKEEVEWNFVAYEDNQPVIDLISKRPICLLGLLDEQCAVGSGTDAGCLSNFHATFGGGGKMYAAYEKPRKSADRTFVLSHFAGEVIYSIEGWVEKNKDELSADVTALVELHTEFAQLKTLAQRDAQKKAEAAEAKAGNKRRGGGGLKKKTVAKSFAESLSALMEKLRSTEHHYIRCLKPNQTLKPGDWDKDFMLKQLAYSGTLEVTQIRKAGLNVRRPLKHFYQYYKMCAEDPGALKAGTITKRTELLLKQLNINNNQYRVGKTLLFLQNYDIIETLDTIREEKILEYVIILQSFFRMLKDFRAYRIAYKAILRLEGFCRSWEIRRAYAEVKAASLVISRYARTYLAYQKFLEFREEEGLRTEEDPKDKERRREVLLKILYPQRFGKAKLGLRGRRRGAAPRGAGGGDEDDDDDDFVEMPRFEVSYEGWLAVKVGMMGKVEKRFVVLKQGILSLYVDHETLENVLSYNLACCSLKHEPGKLIVQRDEKMFKHKVRSVRELGRRFKGPLWGQDVMIFIVEAGANGGETLNLTGATVWAQKLEESIAEAQQVDSYKMAINLEGEEMDDEKPVDQKQAAVIKEGYLRKRKPGKLGAKWERRYFVLYNDGKLKYYDSRSQADEKGSLDLRFFALQEIEEDMEVEEETAGDDEKQALKVQGHFFKIVKGKQFLLQSGKNAFSMTSPERETCDEWISTLQTTLSILYTKSPLFSQDFLRVHLMDGTFTTMALTENTKVRDVVRYMCRQHALNNESEWGLLEFWDHPGINGLLSERKLPSDELVLDQTLLTWEQAARKRYGLVNSVPHSAFKLVLRKVTALLPQARTKKEQHLEFCQALADVKDGRFSAPSSSELFDLAALAIFKDLREGMSEEEQDEDIVLEEGQLTAQLQHYLPTWWFNDLAHRKSALQQLKLEDWDQRVVRAFNELTREELKEEACTEELRKIVHASRLEHELNALAATRMFIERVRLAPLCFSAQYQAEMWSVERVIKVLVVINARGFHVYRLVGVPTLLCSFNFETLVSWQSMNDMLIINIIYTSKANFEVVKRREKLRFLTRESVHMKTLLTKYAEVALQQIVKKMKDREAMADYD